MTLEVAAMCFDVLLRQVRVGAKSLDGPSTHVADGNHRDLEDESCTVWRCCSRCEPLSFAHLLCWQRSSCSLPTSHAAMCRRDELLRPTALHVAPVQVLHEACLSAILALELVLREPLELQERLVHD